MNNSVNAAPHSVLRRLNRARQFAGGIVCGVTVITIAACGSDNNSTAPRTLATITVSPDTVTIAPGGTQQFTAAGKDSSGSTVSFTPTWSVTGGAGSIDTHGLFTAGSAAGLFANSVQASAGTVAATSSVRVGATTQNVAGVYTLLTIDGKAPPDTVASSASETIEFTSGSLTLNTNATYKILFRTRLTNNGVVSTDSSGSTGTLVATGNTVALTTDSTHATVSSVVNLPTITFTDNNEVFVFTK